MSATERTRLELHTLHPECPEVRFPLVRLVPADDSGAHIRQSYRWECDDCGASGTLKAPEGEAA